MVIVCVHFVASSFGHNMACNVSSPEAKAVEMEKFELQFKEICTNYAQNLREKTAAIKFDSSSDEWQSGEKYTYRSMATGQWYSTIIKLDFEVKIISYKRLISHASFNCSKSLFVNLLSVAE